MNVITTHSGHYASADGKRITAIHASDKAMWRELHDRYGISPARLEIVNMEGASTTWKVIDYQALRS